MVRRVADYSTIRRVLTHSSISRQLTRTVKATLSCFILIFCAASFRCEAAASTNAAPSFEPTSAYNEQVIEGWRVLVHTNLIADHELCERTVKLLALQLFQITRVMPAGPLAKLREIPIWVEHSSKQFPCMCYHESR